MINNESIHWSGYEHEHKEKTADWYWALATIAVSTALISAVLGNVLFGVLILAAASALAAIASRTPRVVEFELTEKGLRTGDVFHDFKEIRAFWVEEERFDEPVLIVETLRFMTPHLMIPLNDVSPAAVRTFLTKKRVQEIFLNEPLSHHVLEIMGF
jgi:hypothetical protein